jgi:chromosome segregation ATPase
LIDAFQASCLAQIAEIHRVAQVELDRVNGEKASLEARYQQVMHEAGTLRGALAFAQSEVSLLAKQRDERDARISGLLASLNARDDDAPANDDDTQGERIATLENQIEDLRAELASATEATEESEKETEALRTEITDLEKQIEELTPPDATVLAAAVHDYLRDARLLPARLDAPLRLAPHDYLTGLTGAVLGELP